jgi:hypothetical protein
VSTDAVVTMVIASTVLLGGLLTSIASAVRAERRGRPPTPSDATGTSPTGGAGPHPQRDGDAADATAMPVRPDRSAPTPAAAGSVAADGIYDRVELEAFAAARLPAVPAATIGDVLDLFDEHLMVKGIAGVPDGHRWRFYDPDDPRVARDDLVDTDTVTADAVRMLHLDAATVDRILDAEHAYLEAKGLTG